MNTQLATLRKSELSTQATQLLALGRQRGWSFTHLSNASLPDRPVYIGDWMLVPAQQDTNPIPKHTQERVKAIYAAGIRPAGWVVVHDAPPLLAPPETQRPPVPAIWKYLAVMGGLAALLVTYLGVAALLVDPILVAVTPAGDWIEIDRWID